MRFHRLVCALCAALAVAAGQLATAQTQVRPDTDVSATPIQTVTQATNGSRVEPTAAGFVNAVQIFSYNPTELFRVYTKPGRVTDIALQAGEQIVDISGADPIRWILGNTTSGKGESQRTHISIKPTRADIGTNLIIYTDRRTYFVEVTATPATWMTGIAWEYPQQEIHSGTASPPKHEVAQDGLAPERLDFRYDITGPRVPWRPLRAFDDGSKVYIQFPADIAQHDLPPLFLLDAHGAPQLVNYRVRSPYYIIDRLFEAAELRIGDRKFQTIRIKRVGSSEKP
jgi:P-type conjugative transfer protein TrbG